MEKVGDDVKVNTKTLKQITEEHKIEQLQNQHKLSTLIFKHPKHFAIGFVIIIVLIIVGSAVYYMCDIWFTSETCKCLKNFLENLWGYVYLIGLIAFGFFLKHLL